MQKDLKFVELEEFPEFIDSIVELGGEYLKPFILDGFARIHCQGCGLYKRAILCPPYLYQTYSQFKTLKESVEWFSKRDMILYIFKNDGRKRWWLPKDNDKFAHIKLKRKVGRELKGTEASSAKQLTRMMFSIRSANRRIVKGVDCFIPGHCDLCKNRCPNRDNPPCKRGGMPSLEATGINVHALLEDLGIEFEWPPVQFLTQVTGMTISKE